VSYVLPSISEFKAQFLGDFPWGVPPFASGGSGASITIASASGANSSLLIGDITLAAGGTGYVNAPTIIVQGGGGTGAVIKANVAGGVITSLTLVSGGYGYTVPASIIAYISSGAGDNTDATKVSDYDIANAQIAATQFNVTQGLFGSQQAFTYAYNLLTAHYLCKILAASGAGLAGKGEWITNSKSVGDVSESFSIPDRIMRSPYLSRLASTTYGINFAELVLPSLIGNMVPFHRNTLP
jgi:hypothetical protein